MDEFLNIEVFLSTVSGGQVTSKLLGPNQDYLATGYPVQIQYKHMTSAESALFLQTVFPRSIVHFS